jgi:hypothetical protein
MHYSRMTERNPMQKPAQTTKEQIRQYLLQRRAAPNPPPSIQEIRRQLGWDLAIRSTPATR